jgi:hypothetical protein
MCCVRFFFFFAWGYGGVWEQGVAASIGRDKRKDFLKNKMIRSLTSLPFFFVF